MATIILENVPETFSKKLWNKIDFSKIIWLYWDWLDWCQYNEVIPDKNDIESSKNYKKELWNKDWKVFLSNLISR